LITIRDYELEVISKRCFDSKTNLVAIDKFTDEQLVNILKSNSFGIQNHDYNRAIIRIADRNPQVAIMTAKQQHQVQKNPYKHATLVCNKIISRIK